MYDGRQPTPLVARHMTSNYRTTASLRIVRNPTTRGAPSFYLHGNFKGYTG